ncbi:MAG TPA: hypothetical protein VNP92_27440 [Actinophytocola sp.]|nr:hypothetical protein [Actinophytocola sp.]
MHRHLAAAALVVAALLLAGCASTVAGNSTAGTSTGRPAAGMPDDFAATIHFGNGSVPPPYHFEWELRVTESTADLSWRPGYDEAVPPWTRSVPIDRAQRERLYDRLTEAGVFEPAPDSDPGLSGGDSGSVELVADGRTHDTGDLGGSPQGQDIIDAVHQAASEVVPAEVWTEMQDKQDAWGAAQPE